MVKNKLSSDEITARTAKLNVSLLGNYQGNRIKVNIQCKLCGHIWNIRPDKIFQGSKCPKCKGIPNVPIDNSPKGGKMFTAFQVNSRLPDNVEIINYEGFNKRSTARCKLCSYDWEAYPSSLVRSWETTGRIICTRCNNIHLEPEHITRLMNELSLTPKDTLNNFFFKKIFFCKLCNNEIPLSSIELLKGIGCSECDKNYDKRAVKWERYAELNGIEYRLYKREFDRSGIELPETQKIRTNIWTCSKGHVTRNIDLKTVKKGDWCDICKGPLLYKGITCNTRFLYDIAFKHRLIKRPGIFRGIHEYYFWICEEEHHIMVSLYDYINGNWTGDCSACELLKEIGGKLHDTSHICKHDFNWDKINRCISEKRLPESFRDASKDLCCSEKLPRIHQRKFYDVKMEDEYHLEMRDAEEMKMTRIEYFTFQEDMCKNVSDSLWSKWYTRTQKKSMLCNFEMIY